MSIIFSSEIILNTSETAGNERLNSIIQTDLNFGLHFDVFRSLSRLSCLNDYNNIFLRPSLLCFIADRPSALGSISSH